MAAHSNPGAAAFCSEIQPASWLPYIRIDAGNLPKSVSSMSSCICVINNE